MPAVLLILMLLGAPTEKPEILAGYRTMESCQAQAIKSNKEIVNIPAYKPADMPVVLCYRFEAPI